MEKIRLALLGTVTFPTETFPAGSGAEPETQTGHRCRLRYPGEKHRRPFDAGDPLSGQADR